MSLSFHHVTYRYNRRARPVLNQLNLTITEENTVLLGPNGAGKSTLLELAATARTPHRGQIRYGELTAARADLPAWRRAIALLPQKPAFLPGLTCRQHLAYAGWLKGMTQREAYAAAPGALDRVGMADYSGTRTDRLSGGQAQRVAIAAALMSGPRLLLMDEPTTGLDPTQRRAFHDTVQNLRGQVQAVVSTHDIQDLEHTYRHVIVLDAGRIRFQGTIDEFAAHAHPDAAAGRHLESAYTHLTSRP